MAVSFRRAAALGLLLVAVGAFDSTAQQIPDRQLWVQAVALGQLSENWRTHLEVQPRVMEDASELGLTIIRGAIGRRVTPRVTAFLGYGWVPRTLGQGVRHEQRLWQQLSIVGPAGRSWATSARVRLEQRWLAPWDGPSHRLRLQARTQRLVRSASRWGVFAYDELMLTLDDTVRGPSSGFDRNRLAAGVSRRVSPVVSLDAAYLWERAVSGGTGRRNDHVALAVVNLTLPRR